jgi:hypothetical protein
MLLHGHVICVVGVSAQALQACRTSSAPARGRMVSHGVNMVLHDSREGAAERIGLTEKLEGQMQACKQNTWRFANSRATATSPSVPSCV